CTMASLVDIPTESARRSVTDRAPSPHERSEVNWRHVAGFVTLAYGIAWGVWIALVPHLDRYLSASRTPTKFSAPASVILGMFAPAVAAVIMRRYVSKEPLRTSLGPVRHRGK